jgi:hypothetical protein
MAPSNVNLTPGTTPTISRTSTPLPLTTTDFAAQFPLLRAYHTAVDPLAHLSTTLSSHSDALVTELTNFINQSSQANADLHSLQTLHQDSALELDSLRLINSDLRTQRDELISALSRANSTPSRSAEHPDPTPFSGNNPSELTNFLSNLSLKLRTNADWFPTLQSQMAYVYSRLGGSAAGQLKHGITKDGTITFGSVDEMIHILQQAYGDVDPVHTAQQRVLTDRQNLRQTDLFLSEWQENALASGLSDNTLIALLHTSLHPKILQRLSFTPKENQPTTAQSFLAWIRQVDATLRVAEPQYWKSKALAAPAPRFASTSTFNPDAMDLSAVGTSPVEWSATDVKNKRRPKNQAERDARKAYNSAHNLCQWCCEASHTSTACPTAPWNKGKA